MATSTRSRAPDQPDPTGPADRLLPADWLIAAGLALVALVTRWPMRTRVLAYWDSILYARALDAFTIVLHQPQPPGYFFYVQAARLARWLTGADANGAYVWVSLAAVYLVATALYGRAAGLAAALLTLTAVAPWAYSGVAYPYTVLALGSTLLGGLAWGLRRRRVAPWAAGLALGLASGFRQDLLIFLGPLLLGSLGPRPPRHYLAAGAGLAVGGLAWFLPSALLSGGIPAYLDALGRQSALVERDTSVMADGLAGLLWNLHHLRLFLIEQTLMWATVPLAIFLLTRPWRGRLWRDARDRHLLLWATPAALFYSLIHLGDVGYVFSLVPPLLIAAGAGAVWAAAWAARRWRGVGWCPRWAAGFALTPGLVVWTLLAAGPALYNDYYVFHTGQPYSHLWTRCRDGSLVHGIKAVRERVPPEETLLVAAGFYQHALHYLPEYPAWLADPGNEPVFRRPVPPNVRHVVAFGYRMGAGRPQAPNEERVIVSCDNTLSFFRVRPGQIVAYRPDELWIE
jgi:hypothetical protein